MKARRIAWSIVGVLSVSAAARGGAVLELVPSNPGPYFGGEALTVDFWLRSDVSFNTELRGIHLDFQATDPSLSTDAAFLFDSEFQTRPLGYGYTIQPDLPLPSAAFTPLIGLPPGSLVPLLAGEPTHIGILGVYLPTTPGYFTLDALNAGSDPLLSRASVSTLGRYWFASNGDFTGGRLQFHVVPEPATFVLVGAGLALIKRRRRGKCGPGSPAPRASAVCRAPAPGTAIGSAAVLMFASVACAQSLPVPSERVAVAVDSGSVSAVTAGAVPVVVFSQNIMAPTAPWVRLEFGQVQLSGSSQQGNASFLRITSFQDGATQSLDSAALNVWGNTSAYFNGEAVLLELLAYPGTGDNRVVLGEIVAGISGTAGIGLPECALDHRIPSSDARAGRLFFAFVLGGHKTCTTFLFNARSNCLLTAGHCCAGFDFVTDHPILEFNVPLSASDGTLNHPGPQDQYVVDPASVIFEGNPAGTSPGNDWCYFGVFSNTASLLPPLQAQGGLSFQLASQAPPGDGSTVRVTGYGQTDPPDRLYATQQTATGSYFGRTGTSMSFGVFEVGGNSGSALEQQSAGLVYGIVTHGGCDEVSANFGTVIDHPNLQNALANPQGICAGPPDCNHNGIYDACDIACGPPDGPCDVSGCGKSADCSGYKNDCCVTHGATCYRAGHCGGCADPQVTNYVCNYVLDGEYPYTYCCEGRWDEGCVDLAVSHFNASCPLTPDGIPDECQPNGDCNANGILDAAENLARPVADSAGFLTPGSGSCMVGSGCNSSCHPLHRNRFLSLRILPSDPRNPPVQTAIRVSLVDLQNPVPPNAVGHDPQDFHTYESATCTGDPAGGGGCARWVGKPGTFYENQGPPLAGPYRAARLQCTPCYDDWGAETAGNACVGPRGPFNTGLPCTTDSDCLSSCTRKKCSGTPANTTCTGTGQGSCPAGQWCDLVSCLTDADCAAVGADTCDHTSVTCKPKTITVLGAEIMPSSTYDVQVFAKGCDGHEGTCGDVSCPLQITTARYGDVEAPFSEPSTPPQPDAIDLCQIVYAGQGRVDAIVKARAQLQPNVPELNTDVNALDIVAVVDAIKGKAYPYAGPCPCPSLVTCNAQSCNVPCDCYNPGECPTGPGLVLPGRNTCVKTCQAPATNAGEPCINSSHCPGGGAGSCGNGGPTPGYCRDKCGRCK